ncbi:MATE family efflux transporter [Streptomyces calidiresistens]
MTDPAEPTAEPAAEPRPVPPGPGIRPMVALALPLLVAGLTQITVGVVDTVLLARLSTEGLGALALSAPVYLVALIIARGWAGAVQVRVAHHHGAGRPADLARTVRVGVLGALLAGTAVGAVLYATAGPILTLLGAPDEVIGPGTGYLRILAWAVPAAAVTFTLQGACAGVGATRVTMYNALLVNAVNLPLGLLLIFRAGLGVTGAALSTLIATLVGAGYLLLYCRARLPRDTTGAEEVPAVARGLWRIGWPEMSTMGIGYLNEALLTGFAARIGAADLAAYRLVDTLTLIVFTLLGSAATALTVLAGQELGGDRPDRALERHRAGVRLLLGLVVVSGLVALVVARPAYSLVVEDPTVAQLAWATTPLALLGMVPLAWAMSRGSMLRAAGETRWIMVASVTGDYLLLIPLGWFLGVHLGWGLPGIYTAWLGFSLLYGLLLHLRFRRRFRRPTPPDRTPLPVAPTP